MSQITLFEYAKIYFYKCSETNQRNRIDLNLLFKTFYHLSNLSFCIFIIQWGLRNYHLVDLGEDFYHEVLMAQKYNMCFFTNWNYFFQIIFLAAALTHDLMEWHGSHFSTFGKKLRYFRDVFFCGMVVPSTCFVAAMFWGVWAIDRELVLPKTFDTVIPSWLNHAIHTYILVPVIFETLLQPRRNPIDLKLELTCVAITNIAYIFVFYPLYLITGHWIYNLFKLFNFWQVCIFQTAIVASEYGFYFLQFKINTAVHGAVEIENKTASGTTWTHNKSTSVPGNDKKHNEVADNSLHILKDKDFEQNEKITVNNVGNNENNIHNGNFSSARENEEKYKKLSPENKMNIKNILTETFLKDVAKTNSLVTRSNNVSETSPYDKKSWNLKYRSIRNQFENISL